MIDRPVLPEAALLVQCARVDMDDDGAEWMRRLAGAGLDWPRVLDLARAHGLTPLVSHHLNRVCPTIVPPRILEMMRARASLIAARNLFMARELLALMSMLESNGVQAIPYKGPVLAESLYGSLALREFTDLDILVHPRDAVSARRLMTARNYRPEYDLAEEHDAAFRRDYCEYMFTHATSGLVVEVQWDIAPRFFSLTLDRDGLERRSGTTQLLGTSTPALAPEDLLFILCVHGCKHDWSRLEWIGGISELVRRHPRLDWDLVMLLAARAGARRMLLLGLTLARDLLDAVLPPFVDRAVQDDDAVGRLVVETRGRLFQADTPSHGPLARAVIHMKMRERWSDRLRYCVRLSSTPSARDWARLPTASVSRLWAYPVRMTRLASKYASCATSRFNRVSPPEL